MPELALLFGSISGFLSVALGAFGAHALRSHFSARELEIYETAVRYQFIHALALLVVGLLAFQIKKSSGLVVAGWSFVAGTVLFSGSLYTLVSTGVKAWGAVTPLGGVAFMVGWAAMAWAAYGALK